MNSFISIQCLLSLFVFSDNQFNVFSFVTTRLTPVIKGKQQQPLTTRSQKVSPFPVFSTLPSSSSSSNININIGEEVTSLWLLEEFEEEKRKEEARASGAFTTTATTNKHDENNDNNHGIILEVGTDHSKKRIDALFNQLTERNQQLTEIKRELFMAMPSPPSQSTSVIKMDTHEIENGDNDIKIVANGDDSNNNDRCHITYIDDIDNINTGEYYSTRRTELKKNVHQMRKEISRMRRKLQIMSRVRRQKRQENNSNKLQRLIQQQSSSLSNTRTATSLSSPSITNGKKMNTFVIGDNNSSNHQASELRENLLLLSLSTSSQQQRKKSIKKEESRIKNSADVSKEIRKKVSEMRKKIQLDKQKGGITRKSHSSRSGL